MKKYWAILQKGVTTVWVGEEILAKNLEIATAIADDRGYEYDDLVTYIKDV